MNGLSIRSKVKDRENDILEMHDAELPEETEK